MCQLPPDSHWAIRSHIAAFARLRPAPEVLPADGAGVGVAGAGAGAAALVPTATTWLTGFLVTEAPVWLRDSSLPSTHTSSKVTLCSPATPLVVVFLVPLARVASSWLVTPNATAWVSLTDFFSTRLIVTARPSVSGVSGAGFTRSCAP